MPQFALELDVAESNCTPDGLTELLDRYFPPEFTLREGKTVRKILDAHCNGVFRVRNASGGSGVLGVIPAFGSLHGVIAPAAGFLHHNGLN